MWQGTAKPFYLRYGLALGVCALTIVVKTYLQTYLGGGPGHTEQEAPFMLSLAAVMISGWYGGLGPGLLATGIMAEIGDYLFMAPFWDLGLVTTAQKIRFGLFITEGVVVSVLCQSLNAALQRAQQNEAENRDLQKQLLEITDSEQRRIGHDLHDGLGQHLTGIAFMTKLLEQRLHARNLPESEQAQNVAGLVNKAIGWTRDLARGLAPVDLDREDGLASALRAIAESTGPMYGVACRFEQAGDVQCRAPADAIHIYRIAQEAINNALKHARPTSVIVRLTGNSGKITATIEDDGIGFDPENIKTGGMGLRIMKYRARMIAGQLKVRRREGGGMVVACEYATREPSKEPSNADHSQANGSQNTDPAEHFQGSGAARG